VAECKDIDRALADLSNKINEQNRLINNLQKRQDDCCNKGNKQQQNKPTDLSAITKRLETLEGYCDSIEQLFAQIGNLLKPIIDIFK
jgi:chromosome segregation ATPase